MVQKSIVSTVFFFLATQLPAFAQDMMPAFSQLSQCTAQIDTLVGRDKADLISERRTQAQTCLGKALVYCQDNSGNAAGCFDQLGEHLYGKAIAIRDDLPDAPHSKWLHEDRKVFEAFLASVAPGTRSECAASADHETLAACKIVEAGNQWKEAVAISGLVDRAWTRCFDACSPEDN